MKQRQNMFLHWAEGKAFQFLVGGIGHCLIGMYGKIAAVQRHAAQPIIHLIFAEIAVQKLPLLCGAHLRKYISGGIGKGAAKPLKRLIGELGIKVDNLVFDASIRLKCCPMGFTITPV